jgi:hypothetical protein
MGCEGAARAVAAPDAVPEPEGAAGMAGATVEVGLAGAL